MYSCRQASRIISDAIERRLSPMEWLNLRLHLTICGMCRSYAHNIRTLETVMLRLRDQAADSAQRLSAPDKALILKNLEALAGNTDGNPTAS
jgi:hypothetical protein